MGSQSIPSVYVHIPFCLQMCHYCNFVKYFYKEHMADDYLHALENEVNQTVEGKNTKVQTIYIGGGTPSALNEQQLEKLLQIMHRTFDIDHCEEFTIEVNPGDLTETKAAILKAYGINRISFGVQVMDDAMLKRLGRRHRLSDVYQTVEVLTAYGFANISLDLIYALPNQSTEQFKSSLDRALALDLPHYSTYGLQIEPNTVFYHRYRKGRLHRPEEEEEVRMYEILRNSMEKNGIHQYEISNFAKRGYESKHNLNYWSNGYYYGFGAGAHAYLPGKRVANLTALPAYIERAKQDGKPILEVDPISLKEQIEEEMFLGLRKRTGVDKEKFKAKYNISLEKIYGKEIDQLRADGLLLVNEEAVQLSEEGILVSDRLFEQFILDDDLELVSERLFIDKKTTI